MIRRIKSLFRCSSCVHKQQEIDYLRHEFHTAQTYMATQRKEWDARLESLAKDCMDRVMSRSYTEYAVGEASRNPDSHEPKCRSDEDEWLIEQSRKHGVINEIRQAENADHSETY